MLVYIPEQFWTDFIAMTPKWFDALNGGVLVRRNVERDRYLAYMVKGTDWITARRHGARALNQGIIDFKRCGWTENLGVRARQRHIGLKPGLATGFR